MTPGDPVGRYVTTSTPFHPAGSPASSNVAGFHGVARTNAGNGAAMSLIGFVYKSRSYLLTKRSQIFLLEGPRDVHPFSWIPFEHSKLYYSDQCHGGLGETLVDFEVLTNKEHRIEWPE